MTDYHSLHTGWALMSTVWEWFIVEQGKRPEDQTGVRSNSPGAK